MTQGTAQHASATTPRPLIARVWEQPLGKLGTVLTILMVGVAALGYLFAEALTGHSPTDLVGLPFESTGIAGTDIQGRSVASRALAGGLALIGYSLAATLIGIAVGTVLGLFAGYIGGIIDWIVLQVNDAVLAFPALLFALLAVVTFAPTWWVLVLVIGLVQVPWVARNVRNATRSVTSRDYIVAAQLYATPHGTIFRQEIFPHIAGRIAAESMLRLTYSIGLIASLSFLGVGIQPPTADWGVMINENLIALTTQPWGVLLPLIAIAVLTIGVSLLAEALTRATTPTITHTS